MADPKHNPNQKTEAKQLIEGTSVSGLVLEAHCRLPTNWPSPSSRSSEQH
jgi:hypothetical protein